MSNSSQIIIALSILVAEIIGTVLYLIFRSDWLAEHFGNKLELATIHVWLGTGYKPIKANLISISDGWYEYEYRLYGVKRTVKLPPAYPVEYERRHRIIYAQLGTSYPLALPGKPAIKYCETDIAARMHIDAQVAVYKAIHKNGLQIALWMVIVAIIAVVAIGGGIYWYTSHNKAAPKTTPPITTPTKKIIYQQDGWTVY